MMLLDITLSIDQLIEFLLGPFGTLFLALLIIYTGFKKHWVFGWYAAELHKRIERLEQRVDKLSQVSDTVASTAHKVATIAEKSSSEASGG